MLLRGRDITSSRENYAGLWSRPVHAFPVALHFHLHYFSPHQPAEHSHGGEASQALCLIERTQETASQLSAHKTCPSEHKRSTSINLSYRSSIWGTRKGLPASECQRLGGKAWVSVRCKWDLGQRLWGAEWGLHYWLGSEWLHTTARTREMPGGQGLSSGQLSWKPEPRTTPQVPQIPDIVLDESNRHTVGERHPKAPGAQRFPLPDF